MQCDVHYDGDYAVIGLEGDVDLASSPAARGAILRALAERRHVVVDLGGVHYLDSSGVASLVEGYQTAKERGLQFALAGVSAGAVKVLQLAHLDKVFRIYPSIAEAMADGG
ncbi:MAG: STAS domain-containing protein [Gammaproteobacteria bacterium]|nr:STAS domain-containing protein [Gammaproteobacteria bacterium]